jgi:hypothetical protein
MIPEPSIYYQHRYGGVYQVVSVSTSTVDKSQWVVYRHLWPFEEQEWHRPYEEFVDGRFRELSYVEAMEIGKKDRTKFQLEITANKEAAKKKS